MGNPSMYVEYAGRTYSLKELSEMCGLKPATLRNRIMGGWDIEKAITTPLNVQKVERWKYDGQMLTAKQLAKIHGGLSEEAMRNRLHGGMSPEQAVIEPKSMGREIKKRKVTEIRKVVKRGWQPKRSREDIARCKRCAYSEKFGQKICCMYLVLHIPPQRRGCEPGKHCTRYKCKNRRSEEIKLKEWTRSVKG